MTKGESYDKGIRKSQYTGSYGDFKPRHVQSDGMRYPNDVLFMDDNELPTEDFLYVKEIVWTQKSSNYCLKITQ